MTDPTTGRCRSCGATAVGTLLDLGEQPDADDLSPDPTAALDAPRYRLALGLCGVCGLLQLDTATPRVVNPAHGHGSAYSGTVLEHEQRWAEELLALTSLPDRGRVLDTSSGTGGLLRPFLAAGHAVRGWEPNPAIAAQAQAAGVPTALLEATRDREPGRYDLVLANHTLSHADDLDAAVGTLAGAVSATGTVAVEFHWALTILTETQFDIVCHAHRSYLSLTALQSALQRHGLVVTTARPLPLHGGVVRLQAAPTGSGREPDAGARAVLEAERAAGLGSADAWAGFPERAGRARDQLRSALARHRAAGRTVAGYGAPNRGTTLVNFCALGADDLPRTADRSPVKQGRHLPGAGTRVCTVEELLADPPDVLLVLVWPLRNEVLSQLADLRAAGTGFLFPLPELEEVR